jgi:hypothetical protein
MRKEQLNELTEKFAESRLASSREKLFETVKNIIFGIGDISIYGPCDISNQNKCDIRTGIGANLIYDESRNENVSLCYMFDKDVIDLQVNNKSVLEMDVNSPILEALKVIFDEYRYVE